MAEVSWRVLNADEWPKLGEFVEAQLGNNSDIPIPELSTVLALVDTEDTIYAVISCNLQPVIGTLVTAPDVPVELLDEVYISGVHAIRNSFLDHGVTDAPIIAFNDSHKSELMSSLGFIENDDRAYFGTV